MTLQINYNITIAEIRASEGDIPSQLYTTDIGQEGHWYYDTIGIPSDDNTGTILITKDNKRFKRAFDGLVNVKWFGATGNGIDDDSPAIKKALLFASLNETSLVLGRTIFFPKGQYKVQPNQIVLPNNVQIEGEGKSSLLISSGSISSGGTTKGITIDGNNTSISKLYIRGFDYGIYLNTKQQNIIKECVLSYNRIGIWTDSAYINSIKNNYITFNLQCGIVVLNNSFQLLIKDNVIDNNSGLGLFLLGAGSCTIKDNTIEGNRNNTTGTGCGIFITGTQSKLVIDNNWFEQNQSANYTGEYSTDIYFSRSASNLWQDTLVADCVIDEYKSIPLGNCVSNSYIHNNNHVFTKNGISIGCSVGNIYVSNESFTGLLNAYPRSIYLNWSGLAVNTNVYLDGDLANYGANSTTINTQMSAGVSGSIIFIDYPLNGSYKIRTKDVLDTSIKTISSNYNVNDLDNTILVNTPSSNVYVVLKNPALLKGKSYIIKKISPDVNAVIISTAYGLVDDQPYVSLKMQYDAYYIISNGNAWNITGFYKNMDDLNNLKLVSSNYSIANNDNTILVDTTTANTYVTLTNPQFLKGKSITVKKISPDSNSVVIITSTGTIEGQPNLIFNIQNDTYSIKSDGTNWQIISKLKKIAPSVDSATSASGASPTQAEFNALLAELRDLKAKMRNAGLLSPS
jgi:parallel beta-helix repeat protein